MKNIIYKNAMKLLYKLFAYIYEKLMFEVIGFIFILIFIWARFIYKRLPRDIPFNLSLISLIGLILLCTIYTYYIYKIFRPSSISKEWVKFLHPIAQWLLKPLLHVHKLLSSKEKVRKIMKILLHLLYKILEINLLYNNSSYIYAFLTIVPQIITTICLVLDCFYFKQLFLIYTCIIIITYPLIVRYLMYIYETIRLYDTDFLDKYFIIEITSEDLIFLKTDYEEGFLKPGNPTHFEDPSELKYDCYYDFNQETDYKYLKTLKFINYQKTAILCGDLLYEYKILFQNEREDIKYADDISIPEIPTNLNKTIANNIIQFHINISFIKSNIKTTPEYLADYYLKIFKGLAIINLICWFYILITSLHTFTFTDMEIQLLERFQEIYEPFSDIRLCNIKN